MLLLVSCEKEKELITGQIAGKVNVYTQYRKLIPDMQGIKVDLYRDTMLISSTLSDNRCYYTFENIPYGRYKFILKKDKFVPLYGTQSVFHVGGYSPTYKDLWIYEVPTYELYIDSIGYETDGSYFIFYLETDTVLPTDSFRAFAGSSSDVSKDNFVSAGWGYLTVYYPSYPTIVPVYGRLDRYDFDQNIEKLKGDTIFLRIYPNAQNQGYGIMQFYPEALGKPSNVIKFLWDDLVQKKK
jgi:hypothetical protein